MHDKNHGDKEDMMEGCGCGCGCCMPKEMGREFKLAILNKKEKILEAKMEFVREMKELIKNASE